MRLKLGFGIVRSSENPRRPKLFSPDQSNYTIISWSSTREKGPKSDKTIALSYKIQESGKRTNYWVCDVHEWLTLWVSPRDVPSLYLVIGELATIEACLLGEYNSNWLLGWATTRLSGPTTQLLKVFDFCIPPCRDLLLTAFADYSD